MKRPHINREDQELSTRDRFRTGHLAGLGIFFGFDHWIESSLSTPIQHVSIRLRLLRYITNNAYGKT